MLVSKILAATVAGAAFGTGALALTPSRAADTARGDTGASTSTGARHAAGQHRATLARHRDVIHAEWTTRNKVRHEAIRGDVSAVSATSITVRATDGVTRTFVVSPDTNVRRAGDRPEGQFSISQVEVGDRALVVGKDAHRAVRVVARTPKATS